MNVLNSSEPIQGPQRIIRSTDAIDEVAKNYRRGLAVDHTSNLCLVKPCFPEPSTGFVGGRTFILQIHWHAEGKSKLSSHISGFRSHFALGPVEVIRQTKNNSDGIIFR